MRLEIHDGTIEWRGIAGQLSTCERTASGNTGGRWFVDEEHTQWFVKADLYHTGLQSCAEVVSARILAQLGYPVPETHKLIVGGVHLSAARDVGEHESTTLFEALDTAAVRQLRVVSAYLADWDRVAPNSRNNLVHEDGHVTLIDFGGTLGARALGRHKPGPVEFESVGSFPAAESLAEIWDCFRVEVEDSHPWRALTAADIHDALTKLASLSDAQLDEIVGAARYPSVDAAAAMTRALQVRRDTLVRELPGRTLDNPVRARRRLASSLSPTASRRLGRTGREVTAVGFGTYRVSTPEHAGALREALRRGVRLIDAASSYAGGAAERRVGEVLTDPELAVERSALTIVSKGGFVTADQIAAREREGRPVMGALTLGHRLRHSMHPTFLAEEIECSLERLGCETIDVYLLHNPESFLKHAKWVETPLAVAREAYYQSIQRAFEHFETEVERGRIRWYGISSNTLTAPADDYTFTSLDRVWQCAAAVRREHHFGVIQFPMNLLERGAVASGNCEGSASLLARARELDLGVMVNRPLNASYDGLAIRLVRPNPDPAIDALLDRVEAVVRAADSDWSTPGTLTDLALRALTSSAEVDCTLVGMRKIEYVDQVIEELGREIPRRDRVPSWIDLGG